MKQYEYDDLVELIGKRGWKTYQSLLQKEFDKAYKKLRRSNTGKEISDKNLNYVNGMLDGLEKAIKIVDSELDSFVPEEEKGEIQ